MIIIAIIRIAKAPLPNNATDTVWLFFWQFMEAAAAVLMVSLTAIRSLFGQQKIEKASRNAPRAQQYVNIDVSDKNGSVGHRERIDDTV